MAVTAVVGANWGDEGKGKTTDYLAAQAGIVVLSMIGVAGCAKPGSPASEVEEGFTREEVRNALGESYKVQDFLVPDQPFFGAQEILASLVPPRSTLEEWVYQMDGDLMYVWVSGEAGQGRDSWTVIGTARHPEDAVY